MMSQSSTSLEGQPDRRLVTAGTRVTRLNKEKGEPPTKMDTSRKILTPSDPEIKPEEKTQRLVTRIFAELSDLPVCEALQVIQVVLARLLTARTPEIADALPGRVVPLNPALLRRPRGCQSKITKDPEIRGFIHGLSGYHTIDQITGLCARKFGRKRAPSRSAVGRYLQRLSVQR